VLSNANLLVCASVVGMLCMTVLIGLGHNSGITYGLIAVNTMGIGIGAGKSIVEKVRNGKSKK